MRPSHTEPFSAHLSEREQRRGPQDLVPPFSNGRGIRTEDSWIEVSSRPSSSSTCSTAHETAGTADERASRPRRNTGDQAELPRSTSVAGSSQDEYEESESESDRVMSSSNEDVAGEEDNHRTALGVVPTERAFTPQPNAFSHPPSQLSAPNPFFRHASSTPASAIHAQEEHRNRPHLRRERIATGSFQPDHDAALRASLTTLLSCAAAVRPTCVEKSTERTQTIRANPQPTSLRLVPESELEAPRLTKITKRKSRDASKDRTAKKIRAIKPQVTNDDILSPALASWIISAGVVLVFSVISFSAGYAWGREVGRFEAEIGLSSGSCGREVIQESGLKRLRWSTASSGIKA